MPTAGTRDIPMPQAGPPVPKLGMKQGPEAQQLSAGLAPANADCSTTLADNLMGSQRPHFHIAFARW